MCGGATPALDGLWQGIVSGLTIVVVVGSFAWLRSKWRQREQIALLRQTVRTAFEDMWGCGPQENSRREITYQYLLAVLDVTLQHRTPDLSHKRLGAIRKAHAEAMVNSRIYGVSAYTAMSPFERALFEKLEALDWLELDLDAIRKSGGGSDE